MTIEKKIAGVVIVLAAVGVFCSRIGSDKNEEEAASSSLLSLNTELTVPSQWYMYGGNPQRSSFIEGSIDSLKQLWTYNASSPLPTTQTHTGNILADNDFVYFKYEVYDLSVNGTHSYSLIDKVDNTGKKVYTSGRIGLNHSQSNWAAIFQEYIIGNDDRLQRNNKSTGVYQDAKRIDVWGSILPAGTNFITTQSIQVETMVNLGIRAYDASFNVVWWKDFSFNGRDINRGATCYDNGKVFHAPNYYYGFDPIPNSSGVYCYDNSNGNQLWFVQTRPTGAISASMGKLFLYENSNLICRDQSTGAMIWERAVSYVTTGQPPLLHNNTVIIATRNDVQCFDFNGNELWVNDIQGAASIEFDYNTENTILAATQNTLVVTSDNGIYLLNPGTGEINQTIIPVIAAGYRTMNPVISANRLFVNVAGKNFINNPLHQVICFGNGTLTPPPPEDTTVTPPPPPPPATPSVVLSASGTTLSWVVTNTTISTQRLERKWRGKGKKKWEVIYTGSSPKTVTTGYEYRVIINGTYTSNVVTL